MAALDHAEPDAFQLLLGIGDEDIDQADFKAARLGMFDQPPILPGG